ncbi:MAG: hypothetical protein AB1631_02285 [Acidobacteriota bacterium]
MEAFNVTNRANFAPPVTDSTSAAFGRSRQSLSSHNSSHAAIQLLSAVE